MRGRDEADFTEFATAAVGRSRDRRELRPHERPGPGLRRAGQQVYDAKHDVDADPSGR